MNSVPLIYRLLLLALLPCIVAVLYIKGQSYDPSLIDFRTTAEQKAPQSDTPAQAKTDDLSAPEVRGVAGFSQFGKPRLYTKENLYEHVNGHAEYFIGAGFLGLTITEYISSDSRSAEPELRAEVYDMGKAIQAFGVLMDESGEDPKPVPVGDMGFRTSSGFNYTRDRYYVKITGLSKRPGAGQEALRFAKAFAASIPAGRAPFRLSAQFPDLGKITATRFIKEGYRGLDFLHNVIEQEYARGDHRVRVALISGSTKETQSLLATFFEHFSGSATKYARLAGEGREIYKVIDKYEGTWYLIHNPASIFCVFGAGDEEIKKYFAKDNR